MEVFLAVTCLEAAEAAINARFRYYKEPSRPAILYVAFVTNNFAPGEIGWRSRAHALNHFLKKSIRVAPMAPMAVPSRGSVAVCGPNGELRLGATG